MPVFDSLIRRLNRAFGKEHGAVPVISLSGSGYEVKVDITGLIIKGESTSLSLPITDDTTLQMLVDAINNTGLVTATNNNPNYAGYAAKGLLNDTASLNPTGLLLYPTSLFWNEMSVYGRTLDEQSDRIRDAERQLYLHSAAEDWLEYWLTYFAGAKKDYEDDATFRTRVVNDLLALNQNNTALGNLIRKAVTGLDCEVTDMPMVQDGLLFYTGTEHYSGIQRYSGDLTSQFGRFEVQAQIEMGSPMPMTDTIATITEIVERHKSAGTKMEGIKFHAQTIDTFSPSENRQTHATHSASDILPWGIRYDGSILHNNADYRLFDGQLLHDGTAKYDGWENTRTTYNNEWEADASAGHLTATDQQTTLLRYDGLADFNGFEDFGAVPAPIKEGRVSLNIKRHYLYDGRHTFGTNDIFDGSRHYDSSFCFGAEISYQGIHTILEVNI